MIKLMSWLVAIMLVAWGSSWLADHPGEVSIDFQAWQIETSFAAIALLIAVIAAFVGLTVWFVEWLKREMPVVGSNRVIKRQTKGFELLNKALVSLSSGDARQASHLVEQAELMLPEQPMLHVIAAEAATRLGDKKAAKERYTALQQTEDGRLLGLRGLLNDAKSTGREKEALRLARLAFEENKRSPWAVKTLFALEVNSGEWESARETLKQVEKAGQIGPEASKHQQAALLYAQANELKLAGEGSAAKKLLKQALQLRPSLVPAVLAMVQLERADNKPANAKVILAKGWAACQHPDYVTALDGLDPAQTPTAALKAVQDMVKQDKDSPLSRLITAKAFFRAEQVQAAEAIVDQLLTEQPSGPVYLLKAEILQSRDENTTEVIELKAKAEADTDGPVWQCGHCGHVASHWHTHCGKCHEFDQISWTSEPKDERFVHPAATKQDDSIALLLETEPLAN